MIVITTNNARFVVAFPYISLIVGLNWDFTKIVRIIIKHYGVDFIIVNTINNKIYISVSLRSKC
jgi:hypothetical protein